MAETVANKVGRPTKYSQEMVDKVYEYLNEYIGLGHVIPTQAGLSLYLGIAKDTINDWSSQEEKKEFSVALMKLKAEQEMRLFSGGLSGDYNATIAKLGLGNHGYSDKNELTGKDGTPLIPTSIKTVYD